MADLIERQAAIDEIARWIGYLDEDMICRIQIGLKRLPSAQPEVTEEAVKDYCRKRCLTILTNDYFHKLTSAQPEWNNHTVACLLADMFGDTCACNYNGIDEWLPGKCELLDSCPHPVGVACWEQFLKHKAERRTDG